MPDLSRSRAVVTGASGGVGRAVVDALVREGSRVVTWDMSDEAPSGAVTHIAVDVTDESSVQDAARRSDEALGGIDIIVTSAATLRSSPIVDMRLEDWKAVLDVNVTGTFLTVKHLVGHMPDGGSIITLGSVTAFIGAETTTAYATSKGAVISFAKATALELAPRGIRVNVVCPGWVDAGFTDQILATVEDPHQLRAAADRSHVLGRMARPDEVADAVCFLASESASFITGTELFVDGGFMVKK